MVYLTEEGPKTLPLSLKTDTQMSISERIFSGFVFLCILFTPPASAAQQPGDTIIIQTLNYSSQTRDTLINFPNDPNLSFERILMHYNMRCTDGLVSPPVAGQTNKGCGEWDYSNNTFIYDSSRVDSVVRFQASPLIPGYSGSDFPFLNSPTYSIFQQAQIETTVEAILNESQHPIGTGTLESELVFPVDRPSAKARYLYTADELSAAGLGAGEIDGLLLHIASGLSEAGALRIRLKNTALVAVDGIGAELEGWEQVYFKTTTLMPGPNRFQFSTPFVWDGSSNVLVEFTHTNRTSPQPSIGWLADQTPHPAGSVTSADRFLLLNGNNYVETPTYNGIAGGQGRTVEAWIKTSEVNGEIVSWGADRSGEKWVIRLNDDGTLRLEVNGGHVRGTTALNDDSWHHVAVTFEGNTLQGAILYVDGQEETLAATSAHPVNTASGLPVRISRGVNNRYWKGGIDEVRIWSVVIDPITLMHWRAREVTASHPNFNQLELLYAFNEPDGLAVTDLSAKGRDGSIQNLYDYRELIDGIDLFKGFRPIVLRPALTFLSGEYELLSDTFLVSDSVAHPPVQVIEYVVVSNAGTSLSDGLLPTDAGPYWEVRDIETFNPDGVLIETTTPAPDGVLTPGEVNWYERFPARFEIMSFVTPYGINLDLGPQGKTWMFDVSDFAPILKGPKRMQMTFGGQWQEEMDVRFLFIVGTPPREVKNIQHVWRTSGNENYNNILNNRVFEPRTLTLNPDASSFTLTSAITGHGQEGEFIPRDHFINLNGGQEEFVWTVWKECADNPVYPQGGTWIYDRAGWCPGMATDKQVWNLNPYVTPGENVTIDYGLYTASGDSRYIVNHQLISYGSPNFATDAAVMEIIRPTGRIEWGRLNPICHEPSVIIRNTGSTPLTSLTITYRVNNAQTPEVHTWSGSLEFMETTEVILPVSEILWSSLQPTGNTFSVEISQPNGQQDEYPLNNHIQSTFDAADQLPNHFFVWFGTNNAASENTYEIIDSDGTVILSRNNMTNSTIYRDTVLLEEGCYTFRVTDSDDDGISFFANNDGNGFIRLREVGGGIVASFESDFGSGLEFNFTVDKLVNTKSPASDKSLSVVISPNPASTHTMITADGLSGNTTLSLFTSDGRPLWSDLFRPISGHLSHELNLSSLPNGLYLLQIKDPKNLKTQKLTIQK